ncbi:alkyl hydroperoxide reductase AhpD [Actinoplanes philippinensis]|uniref:Alkylhydroperoxidase AhpD family core domain-containing protein n=1 Tax=Actinoplanes philippinensis TaxID=35752 RepID=A0A1I2EJN2_9ACTN|nr:carboxymuconolactone decarboxylase family protein [Actinoplanes philippinensis]GIE76937.1 alkyl hydroperoxide reductase AhpD [Actinoplanes philippinensis]SFE93065.1 alkylhydroperoxidase AhpD family core domain-containing protein [Actinoplanes philippinensis]
MTYRFVKPAPVTAATGRTAEVHQQMREDFIGPAPAFQALSAVPDIMTATWVLMRESLLAGGTSRVEREIVAAAVSRANRCRFCVDAHATLLHALGEHEVAAVVADGGTPPQPYAGLAHWAAASRNPRATGWTSPYGPQLTGTLLVFHFINRIVSALLAPDLLPGGLQRLPAVRSVGGRRYARTVRDPREPGRGLLLLEAGSRPAPVWAADSPVGVAYAALTDTAARGGELLSEIARRTVTATVSWEDGRHPADPAEWAADLVRDLPGTDRVGARIALLAAFAPAAITAGDVGLWRLSHPADADLVRLVAYGAITATGHVALSLDPAHR